MNAHQRRSRMHITHHQGHSLFFACGIFWKSRAFAARAFETEDTERSPTGREVRRRNLPN